MTTEYNGNVHCFVAICHPDHGWIWEGGPHHILLHVGKYVFIPACYSMEQYPGVVQVGDGRSKGFDDTGNCIYSVPVDWVQSYLTEQEAEDIERMMDADAKLLRYAQ